MLLLHTFSSQFTLIEVLLFTPPYFYTTFTSGYAFRSDGRYFVLAERHKSKDTVGIYDATDSYKLARVPMPFFFIINVLQRIILALSPPDDIFVLPRCISNGKLSGRLGRAIGSTLNGPTPGKVDPLILSAVQITRTFPCW
jgi:hypothetical protein